MSRLTGTINRYELVIGLIAAAVIALVLVYRTGFEFIVIMAIAAGLTILVEMTLRFFTGRKIEDEWSVKLTSRAAMNSLLTTILVMIGLDSLLILRLIADMPATRLLSILLGVVILTFMGWYGFYRIKGDA